MFCKYCGNEISGNPKFCPSCGADLRDAKTESNYSNNNQQTRQSSSQSGAPCNDSIAIIAYLTWIGFIVALILNKDNNNDFVKFHLNQALVLNLFAFIGLIPLIGWLIDIVVFVFWIMGIINAAKGEMKELPIIGSIKLI